MGRDELLKRISIDPEVCFGKPCVRCHRTCVSLILGLLASSIKADEVIEQSIRSSVERGRPRLPETIVSTSA